jgi:hypothetical protein
MSDEIVVIDGWRLRRNAQLFGNNSPRVCDLDIGERIGLQRAIDVRKTFRSVLKEYPNHPGVLALKEITSVTGGRPATTYWADEEFTLLVILASRTPTASALKLEVIRVFMAWRHGQTPPANNNGFDEATARAWFQAEIERRWAQWIGIHHSTPTGSITAYQHNELMRARKKLALAMVDAGVAPTTRSALRSIDNSLQGHTGYPSRAKPWTQTPLVMLPTVHFHLRDLTMQLDKTHPLHTRKSMTRQLSLIGPNKNDSN